MVSSHFSPGPAPHVGQRTACTCLRLGFLAFTVAYDAEIRSKKMFNLVQKTRIVVEKSRYHSSTLKVSRVSIMKQSPGYISPKLRRGDKTMSLPENVHSLLAARAATDPNAARLLKMFTRADEIVSER